MRKTVLVYGVLAGVLIAFLQLIQYRFLVLEHAVEIYGALIALIFAGLGIWLGLRMTRPKETVIVREVLVPAPAESPPPVSAPFTPDPARMARFGITPREHEILQLIAGGLSNREIAERLSVSENTVKTHAGRLFDKLDARRRTQASGGGEVRRVVQEPADQRVNDFPRATSSGTVGRIDIGCGAASEVEPRSAGVHVGRVA